jgi:hypothetical protein
VLTVEQIVSYIKRTLGTPFVSIELVDSIIETIVIEDVLPIFTQYVPDSNRIIIDKSKKDQRVDPKIKNLYWVRDPDEREVLCVVDVTETHGALIASNYPIILPIGSYESLPEMVLNIHKAEYAMKYSTSDLTWKQEQNLNQVWIYGNDSLSNYYSVRYTRTHAEDLSTVPYEYIQSFRDLSLAQVQIVLGNIRQKYGTLNTPLGDIQINTEIGAKGTELFNATVEKLLKTQPTFTSFSIG